MSSHQIGYQSKVWVSPLQSMANAGAETSRIRDVDRDSKILRGIPSKPYPMLDTFSSEAKRVVDGLRHHLNYDHRRVGRDLPRTTEDGAVAGFHQQSYSIRKTNKRWTYDGFTSSFNEDDSGFHGCKEMEDPFHGFYCRHGGLIYKFKKNLPDFDGFWHPEDLMSWIDAIEDFFEEINPPEQVKCKIVWYKMKGAAYYWWKILQNDRLSEGKDLVISWPRMRGLLICRFAPRKCSMKCPLDIHSFNLHENDVCKMGDHTKEINRTGSSNKVDECSEETNECNRGAEVFEYTGVAGAEVVEHLQANESTPAKCSTKFPLESINSKQYQRNANFDDLEDKAGRGIQSSEMVEEIREMPCDYISKQGPIGGLIVHGESDIVNQSGAEQAQLGIEVPIVQLSKVILHQVNDDLEARDTYSVHTGPDCDVGKLEQELKGTYKSKRQLSNHVSLLLHHPNSIFKLTYVLNIPNSNVSLEVWNNIRLRSPRLIDFMSKRLLSHVTKNCTRLFLDQCMIASYHVDENHGMRLLLFDPGGSPVCQKVENYLFPNYGISLKREAANDRILHNIARLKGENETEEPTGVVKKDLVFVISCFKGSGLVCVGTTEMRMDADLNLNDEPLSLVFDPGGKWRKEPSVKGICQSGVVSMGDQRSWSLFGEFTFNHVKSVVSSSWKADHGLCLYSQLGTPTDYLKHFVMVVSLEDGDISTKPLRLRLRREGIAEMITGSCKSRMITERLYSYVLCTMANRCCWLQNNSTSDYLWREYVKRKRSILITEVPANIHTLLVGLIENDLGSDLQYDYVGGLLIPRLTYESMKVAPNIESYGVLTHNVFVGKLKLGQATRKIKHVPAGGHENSQKEFHNSIQHVMAIDLNLLKLAWMHFVHYCPLTVMFPSCGAFNTMTRGRVIPCEGWHDEGTSYMKGKSIFTVKVVAVDSSLNTLCNDRNFREALKLFYMLVNGLDPPMDVDGDDSAYEQYILIKLPKSFNVAYITPYLAPDDAATPSEQIEDDFIIFGGGWR